MRLASSALDIMACEAGATEAAVGVGVGSADGPGPAGGTVEATGGVEVATKCRSVERSKGRGAAALMLLLCPPSDITLRIHTRPPQSRSHSPAVRWPVCSRESSREAGRTGRRGERANESNLPTRTPLCHAERAEGQAVSEEAGPLRADFSEEYGGATAGLVLRCQNGSGEAGEREAQPSKQPPSITAAQCTGNRGE
jgi:hypothetical protein